MQTVEEYVKAYGRVPLEAFLRQIPCPLLVCRNQIAAPDADKAFRTTSLTAKEMQRAATGTSTTLVLQIVKKPNGPFPTWICLGRTRTMDVTLEHSQISKFHAYFTWDEKAKTWMVADAGSTNGTALDSQPLAPKQPVPIKDGSRLNFGTVEAIFRLPDSFHAHLSAMSD